jgi:hypothetical protein
MGATMPTVSTIPSAERKPLNFALYLEAAQSQFYDDLLLRLSGGGTSSTGLVIPGLHLSPRSLTFIQTIRQVEHDHRDLQSTMLATDAVTPPSFNFKLESLNHRQALELALGIEQTTARAYLGLLAQLPKPDHATLLASLQGSESRHVAILAALLNSLFDLANSPISPTPSAREPALNADAAVRFFSPYELI